jgi:hypothetical protein
MPITCADAIREVLIELNRSASIKEIIERIYEKYPDKPWKESTIRAHIIGCSINHPSSHHHPALPKFLYTVGRGLVKLCDGAVEIPIKTAKVDIDEGKILLSIKNEIREMKSFLNGGTSKNDLILCFWVWLCYELELYRIGAEIFRRIDEKNVSPDFYRTIYKLGIVCERKAGSS